MKKFCLIAFLALKFVNYSFCQSNYFDQSNQYPNEEKYGRAEQAFGMAVQSDSNNLIYECQLGLSLMEQDKRSEAEKILNQMPSFIFPTTSSSPFPYLPHQCQELCDFHTIRDSKLADWQTSRLAYS